MMKAKDAVMSKEQCLVLVDEHKTHHKSTVKQWIEISFKAGYKQCEDDGGDEEGWCDGYSKGIREVVEWIHTHNIDTEGIDGLEDAWDEQLKEWGL